MIDFSQWPEAAAQGRPHKLYVNEGLSGIEKDLLAKRGWDVCDLRVLPNSSDADAMAALKCWLQAVRVGSVESDPKLIKFLELESRAYGKTPSEKKPQTEEETDVAALLDFKSSLAFRGTKVDENGKLGPKSASEVLSAARKDGSIPKGRGRPATKTALPELRPTKTDKPISDGR